MTRWSNAFNPTWMMIVFLIAGPLLLIGGGIKFAFYYQTTSKCSAETYGTVVAVEEERHSSYRHGPYIDYVATVEPADSSIFGRSSLRSAKTDYAYEKWETVRIYYNPSDSSKYYIQHAYPAKGSLIFVVSGAVVLVFGLILLVVPKIKKG